MKHLKLKVLAIAGLMFGLGLSFGLSEPVAAKTTQIPYTVWLTGVNMSITKYLKVEGEVAKVYCYKFGDKNIVAVDTDVKMQQSASDFPCGSDGVKIAEDTLRNAGWKFASISAYLDHSSWNTDMTVFGKSGAKAVVGCGSAAMGLFDNGHPVVFTQVEAANGSTVRWADDLGKETCNSDVKNYMAQKLRDAGFNVGNWDYTKDDWPAIIDDPTKPKLPDDPGPSLDPNPTKPDPGTTDPGTADPGTTDPGTTDPVTPMTYGEVDDQASILVGCSRAEKKQLSNGEWVDDETKKGEGIKCIINLVIDIMTVGVGILSVVGITVVGVQYLSAGGSEEKTRKAKRRMLEIVIGVALYVVAYAALKWLLPNFK